MSSGVDRLFLPLVPQDKRKQLVSSAMLAPMVTLINLAQQKLANAPKLYVSDVGVRVSESIMDVTISDNLGLSVAYVCMNTKTDLISVYKYSRRDYVMFGTARSFVPASLVASAHVDKFKQTFNPRTKAGNLFIDWVRGLDNFFHDLNVSVYGALFKNLMNNVDYSTVPRFLPRDVSYSEEVIGTFAMRALMGESSDKLMSELSKLDQDKLNKIKVGYETYRSKLQKYHTALAVGQKMFSYDKWLIGMHSVPAADNVRDSAFFKSLPIVVGKIPAEFFNMAFMPQPPGCHLGWRGERLDSLREQFKLYANVDAMSADEEVYRSVNASLATLRSARNGQYDVYDKAAYGPPVGNPGTTALWSDVDAVAYCAGLDAMVWLLVDAV